MNQDSYDKRFGGIQRLYGTQAQALLQRAHFCVVGVGGVGTWSIEALARSGIGQLTLIDFDDICETNINRQLPALSETIGRKKCEVMAERIQQINPDCRVNVIDDFLTADTCEKYLSMGFDYVIDAIDSIKFKSLMINYCKRNKIPIMVTGGAGGLTDPTQITVADVSRTYNDPLISKVRSQLRKEFGFTSKAKQKFGVDCVFSTQQPVYPKEDGTVSCEKPGIHGVSLDCRFGYGAASYITASFGFMAAGHAINKWLVKKGAE
jgi:tRNA A37 threonylcarbamoyladenosine dehydratase